MATNTSFNFDSSPSDDEDIDIDEFDDTGLLALSSRQEAAADSPAASRNDSIHDDTGGNVDWEDGESDVDWQDADEPNNENEHACVNYSSEEDLDRKMPALPSQGVTVTFSAVNASAERLLHSDATQRVDELKKQDEEAVKTPKKCRRINVLKDVPYQTQQLIMGVRRSHLLCCVARSIQCSSLCSTAHSSQNSTAFIDNSNDNDAEESREMLLNLANSLIPAQYHIETDDVHTVPTNQQLYEFTQWFFEFINASNRRRDAIQQNVARGAAGSPAVRKRARRPAAADRQSSSNKRSRKSATTEDAGAQGITCDETTRLDEKTDEIPSIKSLIKTLTYLSPYYDDDPQLFMNDGPVDVIALVDNITALETVLLFLVMVRSLGWRARFVSAFDPLPLQLAVDHPLLEINSNANQPYSLPSFTQSVPILQNAVRLMQEGGALKIPDKKGKKPSDNSHKKRVKSTSVGSKKQSEHAQRILSWIEVLCTETDNNPKHIKSSMLKGKQPAQTAKWVAVFPHEKRFDRPLDAELILAQVQDSANETIDMRPSSKRGSKQLSGRVAKRKPVSYVLAVEHFQYSSAKTQVRLTDVTPRYASVWSQTLRLRGATGKELTHSGGVCVDKWWAESLKIINRQYRNKSPLNPEKSDSVVQDKRSAAKSGTPVSVTKSITSAGKEVEVLEIASSSDEEKLNGAHSDESDHETKELLNASMSKEPMPTSKAAFKQHPQYVIASVLNSTEVLHPNARKNICGVFKGEMVYRRKDVSKALRAKKWLYQGRKVKEKEIGNPVKKVKARQKRSKRGFQVLDSYINSNEEALPTNYKDDEDTEMESLYGIWQTKPWSPPPVEPHDVIPINEYKNVELALINPGLTHMEQPRLSLVARKLGIPYAPCMVGYEGHNGNRTPAVRGIVVHNHNVELLNEAYLEYQSQLVETEVEARRVEILKKWKRLVVGILTKDRLDKAYG